MLPNRHNTGSTSVCRRSFYLEQTLYRSLRGSGSLHRRIFRFMSRPQRLVIRFTNAGVLLKKCCNKDFVARKNITTFLVTKSCRTQRPEAFPGASLKNTTDTTLFRLQAYQLLPAPPPPELPPPQLLPELEELLLPELPELPELDWDFRGMVYSLRSW